MRDVFIGDYERCSGEGYEVKVKDDLVLMTYQLYKELVLGTALSETKKDLIYDIVQIEILNEKKKAGNG